MIGPDANSSVSVIFLFKDDSCFQTVKRGMVQYFPVRLKGIYIPHDSTLKLLSGRREKTQMEDKCN